MSHVGGANVSSRHHPRKVVRVVSASGMHREVPFLELNPSENCHLYECVHDRSAKKDLDIMARNRSNAR